MSYPDIMEFDYKVVFERKAKAYSLVQYNTPWDNDRELEDLSLMFDGKDLAGQSLPAYKIVDWEPLEPGIYSVDAKVKFIKNKDGSYDQLFSLKDLKRTTKGG